MIPFARQFIDSIYVNRVERVIFVYRQVLWPAVNLPCAREDDFDGRIVQPAGFQDRQLRGSVDVKISQRISHRIQMTRLAGKIEQKFTAFDQRRHRRRVPNIGQIDRYPVANFINIKEITPIFGNQAVHQHHPGIKFNQAARERRTDKTEASRNKYICSGKYFAIERHDALLGETKTTSTTFSRSLMKMRRCLTQGRFR